MKKDIVNYEQVKKQMYKSEDMLKTYACKSKDAIRFKDQKQNDIRLEYEHDIDRIVHSLSYTRYIDKTQVFSDKVDDNISKRMTHVQFVSRTAKTIARALGLNEDLCEAIALGHDIGHVPYGHTGERILNKISTKYLGEIFAHNVQSARNFMYIENNGKGLNLTMQTIDGMLCHNGEILFNKYGPVLKTKQQFMDQYSKCYLSYEVLKKLRPMTLEGCVVRISDIVGYIGKDIEDAILLKKIKREDLPEDCSLVLGNTNKDIMNSIILDIIENSFGKKYICMSEQVFNAVKNLKKFNYEYIYSKSLNQQEVMNIDKMFNQLFAFYLNALDNKNSSKYSCDIYEVFLNYMDDEYLKNTSNMRKVIDYISGMTDGYIEYIYQKNILKGGSEDVFKRNR